jgi:hypothetical protein
MLMAEERPRRPFPGFGQGFLLVVLVLVLQLVAGFAGAFALALVNLALHRDLSAGVQHPALLAAINILAVSPVIALGVWLSRAPGAAHVARIQEDLVALIPGTDAALDAEADPSRTWWKRSAAGHAAPDRTRDGRGTRPGGGPMFRARCLLILGLGSAALLPSGCRACAPAAKVDPEAPASPQASPISGPATRPTASVRLPDLSQATAMRIVQAWSHMPPPAGPYIYSASTTLHRENGGFVGEVSFSVKPPELHTRAGVTVPPEAARLFLEGLMALPLQDDDAPGPPLPVPTDTHSETTIEVDVEAETILLRTSLGQPWRVRFGGRTYLASADAPRLALAGLGPYLRSDALKQLVDRASEAAERPR